MSGDGNDDVGRFVIQGRYDVAARECEWVKTYPGSHDVHCRGFREGKGIWGAWEIGAGLWSQCGFHIWPKGLGEGETESQSVEETTPVDAIGKKQESVHVG